MRASENKLRRWSSIPEGLCVNSSDVPVLMVSKEW